MIVKNEYPPNIEKIRSKLNVSRKGIYYCYGNVIYNPDNYPLPPYVIAHEEVHERQQGDDPEGWWDKYLEDKEFRLEQEKEAHRVGYQVFKDLIKKKSAREQFLILKARDLSSRAYGNMVKYTKAKEIISGNGETV